MLVADIIFWACGIYLLFGLAVGVPFVRRGVDTVDAAAHGTSATFRILILPGCVVLWPWILHRWLRAQNGAEHL
jgi:hypothetical protein